MNAPPDYVIEAARQAALKSPCQKSKRGVAMFNRDDHDRAVRYDSKDMMSNADRWREKAVVGVGFNGPPKGFLCDGSAECRADCAKFCLHAEHRAIRAAGILDDVGDLELVHVKVVDDVVVGGGLPSCWQCSREILDVGVRGVWLYERAHWTDCGLNHGSPWCDMGPECGDDLQPAWRYYTALEFHTATLKRCAIAGVPE